jgi:hypothetical protein
VAEQALPENSTTDEDESRDDERSEVVNEESVGGDQQTPPNWALRGALIGAVAGSVTGAGLGMLLARRPEALAQAREAIGESGGHVARAAAAAAGEVVTSRQLNQLLQGEGNGDRGEMMKEAAREAGKAAATAARDQIISLRGDAAGSSSREAAKGGRNGKR